MGTLDILAFANIYWCAIVKPLIDVLAGARNITSAEMTESLVFDHQVDLSGPHSYRARKSKWYTSHITLKLSQALAHVPGPKPMSSDMEISSKVNRASEDRNWH
ncbi:unnamed protein product [Fusarium equiseti]|uniref:Uncharacterized protein n=1 Tax=Fusarium equiseti TaxID=61235 RepID=A0A8J2NLI1_FUSEQ|nr:unnamed protein product [Fusarium equiseti]